MQEAVLSSSEEGSSLDEPSWVSWFCMLRNHELFCEVDPACMLLPVKLKTSHLTVDRPFYRWLMPSVCCRGCAAAPATSCVCLALFLFFLAVYQDRFNLYGLKEIVGPLYGEAMTMILGYAPTGSLHCACSPGCVARCHTFSCCTSQVAPQLLALHQHPLRQPLPAAGGAAPLIKVG